MACPDCQYYQTRVKWLKIFLLVQSCLSIYFILNVSNVQNKICNIDFDHDYTFKKDPLVWQYFESRKLACDALTMVVNTRDMLIHMVLNMKSAIRYRQTELQMYSNEEYIEDVIKKINKKN